MCVIADKRYITKYAFAMIHELSGGNMGSYSKLMSYSDYVTQLHNTLTNIYLDKCKCDKKELEELLKIDTWFNAEAYLKKGFVDEIK